VKASIPEVAAQHTPGRWPWRGLVVALAFLPLNAYWLVHAEAVGYGPFPTTISLFPNVLLVLLVLTWLNLLVKKLGVTLFSPQDFAVLWGVLVIGSALAALDQLQVAVPLAAVPYYMGDTTTHWLQHFGDELSPWLVVTDREALLGFFRGNSSLYEIRHLQAWLKPALAWTLLFSCLVWGMMGLNSLLGPRWLKRERLTYPVVQVPLELMNQPLPLFRNRVMWAGYALAAGVTLLNGLHTLWPGIPQLNVRPLDLHTALPNPPWNAVGWTPVTFFPFVIGLGYLMPTDLLFSSWFFYWFWKGQQVLAAATALNNSPGAPWITHQTFGAMIALALALLWSARGVLARLWHLACRKHQALVEGAPLTPRSSWLVVLGALAFFIALWSLLGVRVWLAAALFAAYYLMSLAITRIRVEFGSPVHDLHVTSADNILPSSFGPAAFSKRELVAFTYYWGFNRAQRAHEMPQHAEALRVADQTGLALSRQNKILMIIVPLAALVGIWAYLHLAYQLGSASKFTTSWWLGFEGWNRLDSWLGAPTRPSRPAVWAIGVGFLTVLVLYSLKLRFVGWPFHPIAYPVTNSFSIQLAWCPLLIAWVCKVVVMRHGGLRSFRATRPFFVGLILGDITVGCLWSLLGAVLHLKLYSFWGQW